MAQLLYPTSAVLYPGTFSIVWPKHLEALVCRCARKIEDYITFVLDGKLFFVVYVYGYGCA